MAQHHDTQIKLWIHEILDTATFDLSYGTPVLTEDDRQCLLHHMDEIIKHANLVKDIANTITIENS